MSDAQTLLGIAPSTAVSESYTHGPAYKSGQRVTSRAADPAREAVESWHHDTHPGPFQHCYEQPCHAVHQAGR